MQTPRQAREWNDAASSKRRSDLPGAQAIPRIIWQTYRNVPIPAQAERCSATWRKLNPDYDYRLLDDLGIKQYFRRKFDTRTCDVFEALPLGVMQSDMWRYAALYKEGGIYADVDAECIVPCSEWPLFRGLLVGLENNMHCCNWTIASTPGHPILRLVLDMIVERVQQGIDTSYEHFVHRHTGPGIWTQAIRRWLLEHSSAVTGQNAGSGEDVRNLDRYARSLEDSQSPFGVRILDVCAFNGRLVKHHFGSLNFKDYERWIEKRAELKKHIVMP